MPREQVEWFMNESIHDNDKIHAQQSCTYYSIVNVNKTNYPFLSSYEQEQTWTLTRTISNNHKRYQSSIENIHLTTPYSSSKIKYGDYENMKIKKNRSNSILLPGTSSSQKYISSTAIHPFSTNMNSTIHQEQKEEQKILPIKTIINNNLNMKNDLNIKKTRSLNKPMRVIHADGEFVVRI
jgi:hypothetical protein